MRAVRERGAADLARVVSQRLRRELEVAWDLVAHEPLGEVRAQLVDIDGRAVVGLHDRVDPAAEIVVGQADHRRGAHARMLVERGLHFGRVHVRAAREDHVGLAIGEVHVAVGVDRAHVAERLPTAVDASSRRRRRSCTSTRLGSFGRMKISPISPGSASVPSARTTFISPESGRPTEPRCASQSAPLMMVDACASVPAYSSQITSGPSQSIHVSLSHGGHGAPRCHTTFNDDTS